MCNHRWRYRHSLSRVICTRCGITAERAGPDPDGTWHDSMPVALRAAIRRVNSQAAHLA